MLTAASEEREALTELELLNAAEVCFEKAQKALEEAREAAIDILTLCQGAVADRINVGLACGLIDSKVNNLRISIGLAQKAEAEANRILEFAGGEATKETERPPPETHQSEGFAEAHRPEAETQTN